MIKKRPVIVLSCQQSHNRRLCTVVPLSTTASRPRPAWHHPMPPLRIPQFQEVPTGVWAKVDMLATVSYDRLNKPHRKTNHGRVYMDVRISEEDLAAIQECVRRYLQLYSVRNGGGPVNSWRPYRARLHVRRWQSAMRGKARLTHPPPSRLCPSIAKRSTAPASPSAPRS